VVEIQDFAIDTQQSLVLYLVFFYYFETNIPLTDCVMIYVFRFQHKNAVKFMEACFCHRIKK